MERQGPGKSRGLPAALQSHMVFVPITCLLFISVCATSAGTRAVTKKALCVGGVAAAHRTAGRLGRHPARCLLQLRVEGTLNAETSELAFPNPLLGFFLSSLQFYKNSNEGPEAQVTVQGSHPRHLRPGPRSSASSYPRHHSFAYGFPKLLSPFLPPQQGPEGCFLNTQSPHFHRISPHLSFQKPLSGLWAVTLPRPSQ